MTDYDINDPLPDATELLEGIRTLVEMESFTHDPEGKEKLRAFLTAQYEQAGFRVECVSVPTDTAHIVARSPWGGDGEGILLLSHYDTVHPPGTLENFPFSIDGDHAYGPGILDMKSGLHFAMRVMTELAAAGGTGDMLPVTHLIVSDEENCSKSSREIIAEQARRARYVLVTEPAGQSSCITTARKGSVRYTITARGRAAHSGSRHHEGRNAILEAAHQVIALEALTDYDTGVTANCGVISGGIGVNTIPETCEIKLDLRFIHPDSLEGVCEAIENLIPHNPDNRLDITGELNRPAFPRLPSADNLVREIVSAAKRCGFDLGEFQSGGGSDANLTSQLAPTVCGMGAEGADAHTLYERLDISSLVPRYALMREVVSHLR